MYCSCCEEKIDNEVSFIIERNTGDIYCSNCYEENEITVYNVDGDHYMTETEVSCFEDKKDYICGLIYRKERALECLQIYNNIDYIRLFKVEARRLDKQIIELQRELSDES